MITDPDEKTELHCPEHGLIWEMDGSPEGETVTCPMGEEIPTSDATPSA